MIASPEPLISTQGLHVGFRVGSGWLARAKRWLGAVQDVSIAIQKGETLGLVGESGCGKSTLGRALLRLVEPAAGRILLEGQDITRLGPSELRPLRRRMQIVFQDPYSSLNPRLRVRAALGEAMRVHRLVEGASEEEQRVAALLERVGLEPAHMRRYPGEFSGGQRQRIGIARALAVEPRFVVADEPVSSLDVSVQAQICNLLKDLQEELGLGYLFVAHDLNVVEFMSHRIAVMYLGRIVELASAQRLCAEPRHPYTKALLGSVRLLDRDRGAGHALLKGDVPNPLDPPAGCGFHPRCPVAQNGLCDVEIPALRPVEEDRWVSCHLAEEQTPPERQPKYN
ncbi:MAG: ABC transporter ATP-binding protein [Proteobacteria bacterium]|nr:ABC transporter ATP-binding protein [Pseudomonadota bacterium]